MTQTIVSVAVFLVLLALLAAGGPMAATPRSWRTPRASGDLAIVVSAVAVGPHQRVVTVEVGPEDARTWLVLGVTAQNITCLAYAAVAAAPAVGQSARRRRLQSRRNLDAERRR